MRALLIFVVVLGCRERVVTATAETRAATPAPAASQRVALRPPPDAQRLAEGVYTKQLRPANPDGVAIETMPEIFLIETAYDRSGQESATSVPSTTWSDLTPDARAGLAGMRAGEHHIWWCKDGKEAPCAVEDVQVFLPEPETWPRKQ